MVFCCHAGGPNEAMVKSGAFMSQPKITHGGFSFVLPCCQQLDHLDLNVMTIEIITGNVYTKEGIPLSITSTAQVKISKFPEALKLASGQFLGRSQYEVAEIAKKTLEGHQRSIISTLTVEQIYRDRKIFNEEVREVAGVDVGNLGLEIVSFTIKGVEDTEGYLNALGKKRTAEVKRDARIGEAEAERDAATREADARQIKMKAQYDANIEIADSKRRYELYQAAFDMQVNTEKAKAALAGELQTARTTQLIVNEEMAIKLVERKKQIEIENQEVLRKEMVLQASVYKPSEAERSRLETVAEGTRVRTIKEGEAISEANRKIGMAEANVIKLKGEAQAESMKLKANAWKTYTEGAYMEMLIEKVPEIASKIAKPLSNAQSITMVSGGNGDVGASKLTKEVLSIMSQLPPLVESLTGINLNQALAKVRHH